MDERGLEVRRCIVYYLLFPLRCSHHHYCMERTLRRVTMYYQICQYYGRANSALSL